MATLYEYYNTGDDGAYDEYGVYWSAQTFTPSTAHKITSVKLKLYRVGSPGTITVGIRATSSGLPTGADLCSGTINGNTLTTDTAGAWYEITLGAGYDLSASTKYAIVVRALDGWSGNEPYWRYDSTSPTYAGGSFVYSENSGGSWSAVTGNDFMFEEWGELAVTAKTSSDTGSGADAYVSLETGEAKTSSDAGSGVDGTPVPSASLAGSETGSSIDAIIARLLAVFDTGGGVEAASIEVGELFQELFATELGQGSDSLAAKIEMPTKGGGMKLWT